MRTRATSLVVLAGFLALVAASGTGSEIRAQADANDGGSYFGKWKLDVARSDFGETTLAFDRAASGEMQMTYLGRSYRFRVDGNDYPAILGMTAAWKQIDPNTPAGSMVLELMPSGTGGLIITRRDGSCDAKFDGNDYPVHGPSVPPGTTWAIRRTGPRSFDWTTKVNGDVFAETSFTISDDGKRLTGIGGRVADSRKTKVVFDRVDAR